MHQGNQLSREKGTPQRKAAFCYINSKRKKKNTTKKNPKHKKNPPNTHTKKNPQKLNSTFFTCFLPSFPTFHCTLITDTFDKLCAGTGSKAQMKAIFLRAICQRKSQGKPKLQLPLAHAVEGRKMAQERSVSNRDVWKFLSHYCWKCGKKAPKLQEIILRIHLSLPVLSVLL